MLNIDDQATNFAGETVNGHGIFKLSDHAGKAVVISIAGLSWCGPCRFEAPILQRLWEAKRVENVQFVSATHDRNAALPFVQSIVENLGITFPVVRREDVDMTDYEGNSVPLLYILNRDHKVCYVHSGQTTDEVALSNQIDECRRANAPNSKVANGCAAVIASAINSIIRNINKSIGRR